MTLHSPLTEPSLKSPRNQQGTQRELTDRLLLAHRKASSCSLLVRKEQTLIPQGADWQSDRQGLTVCINEIGDKSRFKTIRADELIAISEG